MASSTLSTSNMLANNWMINNKIQMETWLTTWMSLIVHLYMHFCMEFQLQDGEIINHTLEVHEMHILLLCKMKEWIVIFIVQYGSYMRQNWETRHILFNKRYTFMGSRDRCGKFLQKSETFLYWKLNLKFFTSSKDIFGKMLAPKW